ncbi:CRISPR-associated helicase Cas3 [Candidatus Syntrophocurvum alkaliphilum]|uniref:CRISPR-associated helicase Cas3 n=1 Tax=Candidatus Syntrophocurvum alkaliphilum TaxID=2293317 RepID=A0A6I6DEF5_9FIRM|nr:CRISPR-associated helicase Cas3' [Candidatus Syntrophocurvum alkaliphilum]QGT99547.1 CRISPR-associated helicase Cas3 [Candidatus Syntrophocurvum alkaliphilum]
MNKLSLAAQNLWAKKSYNDGMMLWLPLMIHMKDSAVVAERLWNCWLSKGVKNIISAGTGGEEQAEKLFVFLAAIHDLGKATPVFQVKLTHPLCRELDEQIEEKLKIAGVPLRPYHEFSYAAKTPHALATQILLQNAGCNKNVASVLGAHHGKPTNHSTLNTCGVESYGFNYHLGKEGKEAWTSVQNELTEYALKLAEFPSMKDIPHPNMISQVLLSGLLVMTDWIASNEDYFPYIRLEDSIASLQTDKRIKRAWKQLSLSNPWEADNTWMNSDLYQERFGFVSTGLQKTVIKATGDINTPGILVLEAPMGVGKTEAALACAEVFAEKTNRQGVFFALPTQATSDGIFPRLKSWISYLDREAGYTISLAHGKAQFNEEYQSLKIFEGSTNINYDEEGGVLVHEWFEGQKKSMLADFVVGTIDQLLLASLKQKHLMLRHLGLANKVVVIDECHAYDAYMGQYLNRALNWLGAYGVPVIVLSATLPAEKRQSVIDAYLNEDNLPKQSNDPLAGNKSFFKEPPSWAQSRGYPLMSYTDGVQVRQEILPTDGSTRNVKLGFLAEETLLEKLEELLSDGGCVGILVNTVKRAQVLAEELRIRFGEENVKLLHSRFLAPDRAEKERVLMQELGKPGTGNKRPALRIVVGTQILEQSLDIDFDLMITDLCPIDLLLQRIGRLHRHIRARPSKLKKAQCFIMGVDGENFESTTEIIYGKYLLMRTKALLPQELTLPNDIPELVQDVYDENVALSQKANGYDEAEKKWKEVIADKEKRAKDFRIGPAWQDSPQNLVGWMDTDISEQQGEATVRDTDESIEVILIQEKNGGRLYFLSETEEGREIPLYEVPGHELARALARQRVRLPNILCMPWSIEKTISELEKYNSIKISQWQQSPWLKGELALILNESFTAKLGNYCLTYHQQEGLSYEKEEAVDA